MSNANTKPAPAVTGFGGAARVAAMAVAPAAKAAARAKVPASAVITVLAAANPKKPGSLAAARFPLYATCPTVGAYVAAAGKYGYPDINYDLAKGYISVA